MKVFDLVCDAGHRFEGWFASAETFAAQCAASVVRCPMCESGLITREPSAPRLNLGHGAGPRPEVADPSRTQSVALLDKLRRLVAETEDVGERFAEEARRIHYDETPARAIRGTATDSQQRALADEGIETFRLPVPRAVTEVQH